MLFVWNVLLSDQIHQEISTTVQCNAYNASCFTKNANCHDLRGASQWFVWTCSLLMAEDRTTPGNEVVMFPD